MDKGIVEIVQNDHEMVDNVLEQSSLDPVEMRMDDVLYDKYNKMKKQQKTEFK